MESQLPIITRGLPAVAPSTCNDGDINNLEGWVTNRWTYSDRAINQTEWPTSVDEYWVQNARACVLKCTA
jgi:hypothetical protein